MLPLSRILIFALCGVTGYSVTRTFIAPPSRAPKQTQAPPPAAITSPPAEERSLAKSGQTSLLAEWAELRASNGNTTPDMPALYTVVKAIKEPFRRRAFRAALLAEWAELDPQAALAFIQEKDKANAGQLMREWLRLDPQGAVTGLLAGGEKNRSALRGMLDEIARVAPTRLGEVVAALPKSDNRWDTTTQDAFAIFAKKDAAAARAAAESITGALRGQALAGVAKSWAEADGAAALEWAQALEAGEARDTALKAVLTGWAKTDPVAALGKLDLVPPGGEEMYYASDVGAQVLREAAKKDWDGTVRWLREHPGKLGRSSLDGLQSTVSQRLNADPAGTLQSLAQSGLPALGGVLANSFLNEGYAKRDAVWEWLDQQPPDEFTRSARASMLNAIAWKEPEVGLQFLEKLEDTPENRQVLEQGTRSLINGASQMNRFEDLLGKASAKIRPLLLEAGFQYGLQNSVSDPALWLMRIDELPVDRRANAIGGLARGWATNDPEAAVQWSLSLADPGQKYQALNNAMSTWARTDVYEASEWVNSLPVDAYRDVAARNLVGALSATEPESAWTWALSIRDPGERQGALQLAYAAMRKKDPGIAQQMLQNANLSVTEAKALQEQLGQGNTPRTP